MAQRLATNYTNAYFTMSEHELDQFVDIFSQEQISVRVHICQNGDRDVCIEDSSGEITLTFHRTGDGRLVCESSYLIEDLTLANAMRKAMKRFRGHGIVHRIYKGFTIVYHYDEGSVVEIKEVTDGTEVSIYEAPITSKAIALEALYRQTGSEKKIHSIRERTDRLLDLRNWAATNEPKQIPDIDRELSELAHQMFVLEA